MNFFIRKNILIKMISISLILLLSIISSTVCYIFLCYPSASAEEILFVLSNPIGKINTAQLATVLKFFIPPLVSFLLIEFLIYNKISHILAVICSVVVCCVSVIFVTNYFKFWDLYTNSDINSLFIEDNYIDPNKVTIKAPSKKKNIIHIYLESVETTFASKVYGGGKNINIISELTKLGLENECFSDKNTVLNGGHALYGGTWTMGSVFSHESGLPLKTPKAMHLKMDQQKFFFKDVICFGDILKANGYTNVVIEGSDSEFAGASIFYRDHGSYSNQDISFYKKMNLLPNDYNENWGFEDIKVFEFAKAELLKLSEQDKPFNLELFTLDTHFEDGYVCPECPHDFEDQYSNVYSCSSRQVNKFIEWCKQQKLYENTVIVLTGDHPTMDKDFCDDVDVNYDRKTFVSIINSDTKKQIKTYRNYSTFDLFPTMLSAMGFEIQGHRLGLGVDLYSNEKTLLETYGKDYINNELAKRSAFMNKHGAITRLNPFVDSYRFFNEVLEDLIEANPSHNLITFIVQSEYPDEMFDERTRNYALKLGLKGLAKRIENKNYDEPYIAVITRDKVEEITQQNAGSLHYKVKAHDFYASTVFYKKLNKFLGYLSLDNSTLTPFNKGVSVIVYNVTTDKFDLMGMYSKKDTRKKVPSKLSLGNF